MILERAVEADLPAILALEAEGFGPGGWSENAWRSELDGEDRHLLVARDPGGALAGVATFQSVLDTADLHRVVVRSADRGRGIGRRLVSAGLDWARGRAASRMLLEVGVANGPARRLYERLGFVAIARRRDYYGRGLDALVMAIDLAAADDRSIA